MIATLLSGLKPHKRVEYRLAYAGLIARACLRLITLTMLSATVGCADEVPALRPLTNGSVLLAFGDSLTFGNGANEATSYPAVLVSLIGRQVVRSGVPGEVCADGLARLPEVLEQHTPKLMILCHGGNDLLRTLDST